LRGAFAAEELGRPVQICVPRSWPVRVRLSGYDEERVSAQRVSVSACGGSFAILR
jgi:hypothetical protein